MARSFSATTDIIKATTIATGITNWTVSAWVRWASPSTAAEVGVCNGDTASSGYGFQSDGVGHATGFMAGVTGFGSANILADVWYHVAITRDTTTGILFVNSVNSGTTGVAPATPVGNVVIGNTNASGSTGTGRIVADAAIWNTPLSSADIARLYAGVRPVNVNSANLQGWWPLDGYASPETDLSGNGNNGTLTGTTRAVGPPHLWRISG